MKLLAATISLALYSVPVAAQTSPEDDEPPPPPAGNPKFPSYAEPDETPSDSPDES